MHRSSVPLLMSIKIVYNPPGFFVVNDKLMKISLLVKGHVYFKIDLVRFQYANYTHLNL